MKAASEFSEFVSAGLKLREKDPEAFRWLLHSMQRVAKARRSRREKIVAGIRAEAVARFGPKAARA